MTNRATATTLLHGRVVSIAGEVVCHDPTPMNETPLEAARRELGDLYKRLSLVRPMSRERISIQMQIARVRRRISKLERNQATPPG
jgi:hypothetical protein